MDPLDLSSNHDTKDKDAHLTNSDVITPESVDTGFVSDGSHQDSPSPLLGNINVEDSSVSQTQENVQLTDNNQGDNTVAGNDEEKAETSRLSDEQSANIDSKENPDLSEDKVTENEDEGSIDILGNGLLKKKVIIAGDGIDTRPINGNVVTLKVKGYLDDEMEIQEEELIFGMNDGDVIVAFELAVALMEKGETCELITSPKYAYGELGREPDIPKDATITYTLELVDVAPPVDISTLAYDQRLKMGEQKRERGNYLFKRSDFSGAINSYNRAVKILDDTDYNSGLDESSRVELADCWTKCYNNMAACQLKITALDAAIRSCEKVLSHESANIKALFRIGKAYGAKGEVDTAISYLRKAIKLDPESKIMHQEMLALTRRKNKETESERMLYQRMLGVKAGSIESKSINNQKGSSSVMKWTLALGAATAAVVSIGLTWYRNS